ncbi:hypothetical protein ACFLU6_02640 [Acidobacteriota bacterium]
MLKRFLAVMTCLVLSLWLCWSWASVDDGTARILSIIPSQFVEAGPRPDIVIFYTGSNRGHITACG